MTKREDTMGIETRLETMGETSINVTELSIKGGTSQKRIIFWRVGFLKYRLPLLGAYSRNLRASVYQLVVV